MVSLMQSHASKEKKKIHKAVTDLNPVRMSFGSQQKIEVEKPLLVAVSKTEVSDAANSAKTTSSRSEGVTTSGKPSAKDKKEKRGKKAKTSAGVDGMASSPGSPTQIGNDLPEGVIPLFISSKTQEIVSLRCDEDVTVVSPTKLISREDILTDLFNRAGVSDFHPVKQIIADYQGTEILFVFDPDFKYGQNFIVATTEEAKLLLLKHLGLVDEPEAAGQPEEIDESYIPYTPPVAKEWIALGSEKEIEEESIVEHRKKMQIASVLKKRSAGDWRGREKPVCHQHIVVDLHHERIQLKQYLRHRLVDAKISVEQA